jgi:hypothetical protein
MTYFVGAYASSPSGESWNPELEAEFYSKLKQEPNIKGLEHPFLGSLHLYDDTWFLENIDPTWNFVFTCIPGTMNELGKNPEFGLASTSESGRLAALAFLEKARVSIKQLNSHLGRQAVTAIQIHSAPKQPEGTSSKSAFQTSLGVLLAWDWDGAKVVVEHCDTLLDEHPPAKGFLSLAEEASAIITANRTAHRNNLKNSVGMVINWGRSVIETRHPEGAIQHIHYLNEKRLLCGIMFSGVSDKESEFGVWQDSHMPPTAATEHAKGESDSLMSAEEIHKCLRTAKAKENKELILGIKLGIRPSAASIEDRIAYNANALSILDDFFTK